MVYLEVFRLEIVIWKLELYCIYLSLFDLLWWIIRFCLWEVYMRVCFLFCLRLLCICCVRSCRRCCWLCVVGILIWIIFCWIMFVVCCCWCCYLFCLMSVVVIINICFSLILGCFICFLLKKILLLLFN